ncbi:hypothetical protein [Corynebacterium uterequi]|uniref:Uncharacterized protein n=1 Tax=Corynebacterium uterequi TaxID=1072256 RepID=A0A0G3HL72_9CORY|nr:hypothetical protein [Corynebacterium uterequi]AKK11857.1 hypothetical protein CUTER_09445 [Corynebacterium uterequi]
MTNSDPRPGGRLPEKYYQRRRIAALIGVLLVVALLVWGLSALARRGNPEVDPQAASTGTTTPAGPPSSTDPAPSDAPYGEEKKDQKDADSAEPSEQKQPTKLDRACELKDLRITAASDQPTYPAGVQPVLYMTVENPTDRDCAIDLDKDALRFEVYSLATNARVWSDVDCSDPVETGEQTFPAGGTRTFQAVWSRTGSAPGKCTARPEVEPGGYFLHAVIGDNPSPGYTFNLR